MGIQVRDERQMKALTGLSPAQPGSVVVDGEYLAVQRYPPGVAR